MLHIGKSRYTALDWWYGRVFDYSCMPPMMRVLSKEGGDLSSAPVAASTAVYAVGRSCSSTSDTIARSSGWVKFGPRRENAFAKCVATIDRRRCR